KTAQKLDPRSDDIRQLVATVLLCMHRNYEAARSCEGIQDFRKRSVCLGRARLAQGRSAEGTEILAAVVRKGVPSGSPVRGYLAYAYARCGRRAAAEEIAASDRRNPYHQVLAFAGLGDKDRAFEALQRMAVQGPVRIGRALAYPELEQLLLDPRAAALR